MTAAFSPRLAASSMSRRAAARRFVSAAASTTGAADASASARVPFVVNITADFPLNDSSANSAGELP